ncbi:MAG: efflux RND transporter periplasmic adaptor subunit [Lachnospiraceae bacterium]|nr:efflux RND transporter periplasmic adaptor subunit [Lachnospiraceae bacterium]
MSVNFRKGKIVLSAAVLGVLVMLAGCGDSDETTAQKDVVVETCMPQQGDLVITGSFMGTVAPKEEAYVIPLVNGEITDTYVQVGDRVQEGTILARIDDTAAQLQLDSANASLGTVQANKTAATGTSATLQNMQTEANIETIKDNISALDEKRTSVTDAQGELQEQMDKLTNAKSEAKDAYDAAKANLKAAKALAKDPSDKEAKKTLKAAGIEISQTNPVQVVVATCEAAKTVAKQAYDQVKTTYDQSYPALKKQYDELDSSKKEIDRNADALNDNLKLAQDSYALSKGQLADETAAVYDAQIQSAKVGVESAKYQQDMYTLKAPIDGVVEAVYVEENGFASSGSPAFVISDKESMKATFKVSEAIQKTLSVGDRIVVERGESTFDGTISQIGQMVDAQSGLFLIEADVKAGGDDLLTGTSVKLSVPTYKEKNTLIIPYDAIFYDNREAFVYVVKQGRAARTAVEVALFDEENAAISSGITAEDEVITTYSSALADQAGVVVKESSAEQED